MTGTQFFGGPHSSVLMEVTVPVWKNNDCQTKYAHRIHDTVLCAGDTNLDSCQGEWKLLLEIIKYYWFFMIINFIWVRKLHWN